MSSQGSRNEMQVQLSSIKEEQGIRKTTGYIPGEKSGKWSEEQHMKYIVFIDYNKEKMRSKEKRRSNKFYEQMANFITTRNSLQCRSHHQKLQEKYTHVNKIIALFKVHFNKTLYKKFIEHLDTITHEKAQETVTKYSVPDKIMVDAIVQTELEDINVDYVQINPNLVVMQKQRNEVPMEHMSYPPPPLYYSQHSYPFEMSTSSIPSPSYPYNHMGMWGSYHPNQY